MQATLCENLSVDIVSPKLAFSIDTVAIIAVRQFPPRIKHLVTLYSLYAQLTKTVLKHHSQHAVSVGDMTASCTRSGGIGGLPLS